MGSTKSFTALIAFVIASNTPAIATVVSADTKSVFASSTLRDRPLDEMWTVAGALDIRKHSDFIDNYADDIADTIFFAPGVTANVLDIQEPRLSIRGFGLGNSNYRSNVLLLRDGAPLTDVHGTTNTSEINPYTINTVSIVRGVANLRDAGGNLGGVVHLRTLTGRDVAAGSVARIDGGVDRNGRPDGQLHARFAGTDAGTDYFISVTGVYENGSRDNNQRASEQINANVGFRLSRNANTRFFVDAANSDTELAGGIILAGLENDPQSPTGAITLGPLFPGGPIINLVDGARTDDFARDIREGRIANETTFRLFGQDLIVGGHYTRRNITAPQIDFVGFQQERGGEWGARLSFAGSTPAFGDRVRYRAGASRTIGTTTQDTFENDNGVAGAPIVSAERRSRVFDAFVEGFYNPIKKLTIDLGAKFFNVNRQVTDLDGGSNDSRDFTGVAARGGASYAINERLQSYASVSRSYEPPTLDALTAGDPVNLNGLSEQDTFSLEAGLRGDLGERVSFDIAFYNTSVENEIISVADPTSPVDEDIFINADNTRHRGIETAIDVDLIANTSRRLTLRNVYNYSDHRFTNGGGIGVSAGNRIGGIPAHAYRGELRYEAPGAWFASANVQLQRGAFFIDHENTTQAPTAAIIGLTGGYTLNDRITLFASAENILDSTAAAGISPVLEFREDDDRIFTPVARASIYGGLRYRF